ncbi:DeoR/GlpR family DNA-binding transcription regulator [Priestia aryabhattai]|uniref:DeoR/GlpR family DNA-binding transcription regulator n=1 Tax=Priestia aryabhattai TaxID=412384 RepID=UPI003981EBD4
MSLTFEERKKVILNILSREEKIEVRELSKILQVSGETIRRDLDKLDREGVLRKVYGGAVKEKTTSWDTPFQHRSMLNQEEKQEICKAAASLIEDGDTIMIGHGTTTMNIVRHLDDKPNVMVITNSVQVLNLALEAFRGRVIFIGGEIDRNHHSSFGFLSEEIIKNFRVNKVFISASGLSMTNGITDHELEGANISRKLIERGENTFILVDHTKFGKTTFTKICSFSDISMVITDKDCSEEWKYFLDENEIEILIAERTTNTTNVKLI